MAGRKVSPAPVTLQRIGGTASVPSCRISMMLPGLARAITVARADQTYVLDISVRSGSADRSARIAQALADTEARKGRAA